MMWLAQLIMIRKRYERIPFVAFFFAFMVAKGRSFGLLRYGERNDSKHSKRVPACDFWL